MTKPSVYLKKDQPETMRISFEILLHDYPEISCDHPNHTPKDEWVSMDQEDYEEWMRTGIKPAHLIIV